MLCKIEHFCRRGAQVVDDLIVDRNEVQGDASGVGASQWPRVSLELGGEWVAMELKSGKKKLKNKKLYVVACEKQPQTV